MFILQDFDKDKTLDHFFQRNQIKEVNKKRTRKQIDKNPSISSENMKKSEPSIKDIKVIHWFWLVNFEFTCRKIRVKNKNILTQTKSPW